jgi:hypothetical protein
MIKIKKLKAKNQKQMQDPSQAQDDRTGGLV